MCACISERERDQARAELEEAQRDANNWLEEAQRDANHRLEEAQQAAADLEVLGIEWTCVCIQMTIVDPGLPRVAGAAQHPEDGGATTADQTTGATLP